jgi:hypothetical protein
VAKNCAKTCSTCGGREPVRNKEPTKAGETLIFSCNVITRLKMIVVDFGCVDTNSNCKDWVANDKRLCASTQWIIDNCRKSCGVCGTIPPGNHVYYNTYTQRIHL